MAESTPPFLTPEELEGSRNDLRAASTAVSQLPSGLVKRRMEAALKDVDAEIQEQLWGHLRSNSASSSGAAAASSQRRTKTQAAGVAVTAVAGSGGGGGGGGGAAAATAERTLTASDSPTGKVLGMAHRARVTPKSALHAAALAVHCLLVVEGFVCTGQDDKAGSIKGFAAPVRDVPADKLVPDRWDADQSAVSFRYRRPDKPGKVYLFKTAAAPPSSTGAEKEKERREGQPAQFFLGEKGGEIMSADVDLGPLERISGPNLFESEDFFQTLFSVFRREVLSPLVPLTGTTAPLSPDAAGAPRPASGNGNGAEAAVAAAARAEAEAERLRDESERGGRAQPRPAVPGAEEDDPLRVGPPRFAGPPGVGPSPFIPGRGGDFSGDLFPSGVGGPAGGGGGGLPGPGGLLGPGHPMFGGGGGAGYMEPRYDPYGPPLPGQPWGPGVPGRGAGRGGPAQGGPRGPPGGPDNDHLRPPGGPGNMFF
eukprot:g12012.t2